MLTTDATRNDSSTESHGRRPDPGQGPDLSRSGSRTADANLDTHSHSRTGTDTDTDMDMDMDMDADPDSRTSHVPADIAATAVQLSRLLDDGLRFSPEFGPGFSNHLPMALQALHALGASEPELQAHHDRASGWLPVRAHRMPPVDRGQWRELRGHWTAFETLCAHFERDVRTRGPRAVLTEAVPLLIDGVGAAAFHGLIRTAHGVSAEHASEVATGLAYWASRHLRLIPGTPRSSRSCDLTEWLDRVERLPRPPHLLVNDRLITSRMRAWATAPRFDEVATSLVPDASTLDGLARCAAARYAQSADFTVLHLVTATHALRVLQPWWGDAEHALGHVAVAVAAAWRAAITRPDETVPPPVALPWAMAARAARASGDDHVIKLVHACREHEAATGAGEFGLAAARGVQPVPAAPVLA